MASVDFSSPRQSRASSNASSKAPKSPLSLDLSDLPPLITPSEPSNTLIITNLHDVAIFHPANLATIRDSINERAELHSFAPLKSFRRIIASFFKIEDAISIRQQLDGTHLMGCPTRVFFGEPTPINPADQHLDLPKSARLFFISPPPSPPHGWEVRNEDPPNKMVHAEDLATALAKLNANTATRDIGIDCPSPTTESGNPETSPRAKTRKRGSSTVVYHPDDHGDSPLLPVISVDDTTGLSGSPGILTPLNVDRMKEVRTERPPMDIMTA
ncbi:Calcipressin-domain-containing protein [Pseudovirgaria hyperparasitica]|uniref:Calcipressin-domain-containing protein n=1 Tax=Pseudovirgaria hyperparasitica TaxID=470096 RepID=A0A6A6VSN0_9PEZI|nr:Calcipressin-domain-containing protein [Pseudovirgaria hyperparasitica]KAF2752879.1 Calcipressin-domain-containing protein [Pseudovirgaria hyperparasitica]